MTVRPLPEGAISRGRDKGRYGGGLRTGDIKRLVGRQAGRQYWGRSHGGGRADGSRGLTDVGRAGGGLARGGDGEPMSQGDAEDPEGQGGADGSGDRGRDPEGHSGAASTEDQGGAGGKEESDRARGMRYSWKSGVPRQSRRDENSPEDKFVMDELIKSN